MAKITYEFDTCAENFDNHELWVVQNANKMWLALCKMREQFREWNKYRSDPNISTEEVYDFFYDTINHYGFNGDDFI